MWPGDPTRRYDIRLLGVEGRGWAETKAPFVRLPARAEGLVRDPVWELNRQSAALRSLLATRPGGDRPGDGHEIR